MKPVLLTLALFILSLNYLSASEQSSSKQPARKTEVKDGADIGTYDIDIEELSAVLDSLRKSSKQEVMWSVIDLFKPYVRLPVGYKDLIDPFEPKGQTNRYIFSVGKHGQVHIVVNPRLRIIKDRYYICPGGSPRPTPSKNRKKLTNEEAMELLHNYMLLKGWKIEEYTVRARPYGKNTIVLNTSIKFFSPPKSTYYLVNKTECEVREKSLETLSWVFNREFPPPKTEEDFEKRLKKFIAFPRDYVRGIISSATDIPGYQEQKLDLDIEKTICPIYRTKDKNYPIVYIIYTYERVGGRVLRYRFPFEKDGRMKTPSLLLIGRDIGQAVYLE